MHIVDASNGTIAYEYVAKGKINSNWAVDRDNQRVLIVGDTGKAQLIDVNFGTATLMRIAKAFQMKSKQSSYYEGMHKGFEMNETQNSFSKKSGGLANSPPSKKVQFKWKVVKNWFEAHKISKLDDSYVVSVKFANVMRIFVTGTSKGEVKLWSNSQDIELLGVLNS